MNPDEVYRGWMKDLRSIAQDVHTLFIIRRTFREVYDVFKKNKRLQETGAHLWTWMLMNYTASVLMRVRAVTDNQNETLNLKQLLHSIIKQPEVITRGRRNAIIGAAASPFVQQIVDKEFTAAWVRRPHPTDPSLDHVEPEIVVADLRELEKALQKVTEFANRTVAHKTRNIPEDMTFAEIDKAINAIEAPLQRYHALVLGVSLMSAEPTPQFNTHEVFSFPWIEGEGS